jgi:hypothetical protein
VLFGLMPTNEISNLDPYDRLLGKCCIDSLRRQIFRDLARETGLVRPEERAVGA